MKKKIWIIVIAILLVMIIVAAVIVGIFLHNKNKEDKGNDSVGSTWGDTYYAYLTEAISEEDLTVAEERYGMKLDMENAKLQFCEVEQDQNPTMIMTYNKNNSSYINIYQIDENNKVIYVSYKQPTSVEYLYNIEKSEYLWYVHKNSENDDSYSSLKNIIEKLKQNSTESEDSDDVNIAELDADYTINKNETEVSQETVDGTTLTYSKFDELFVKPEITLNKQVDFNVDIKKDELKKSLSEAVGDYAGESSKLTDEIKAEVTKKVDEIKKKIEEVNTAKEALEKKKAEEEANKGIKVGNYTLKYGTYIGKVDTYETGEILVFNKDGTCQWTSSWYGKSGTTRSFTYKVGSHNFAQGLEPHYEEGIVIYNTDGTVFTGFLAINNTTLSDGDLGTYIYSSNATSTPSSASTSESTSTTNNTSSQSTSTSTSSTTTSSNSGKLTSFEYDTSANNQIATGTYYRGKDTGTESKLEIKSSTGNSIEFSIDAIYMLSSGYPNIGEVSGTAKAIKGGGYVYTEHEEGTYGWDYNLFFKISGSGSNPTITIEDECYYNKYGLSSESPACGHNVTFDGTYSK